MAMAARIFIIFVCEFVCGFGAIVFSPAHPPLPAEAAAAAGLQWKGRTLANKLQQASQTSSETPEQVEPAADKAKENEEEKESRTELLAAASLFNAASSQNTEEQQAAEEALREAMSTPSRIGRPDRSIEEHTASTCLPDFTKCPKGWNQEGVYCVAGGAYSGPCAAEADLTEMSVEQKIAFASFCAVAFPCQADCAQNFQQTCPSLWREIGSGVCSAPLQYEGSCAARLDVTGMSEEDKSTWSLRCGARWPCTAPKQRSYEDVCPKGWSLQSGQVCTAPTNYNGPCEHTAYMSGATALDKKAFEATCHAEWPETAGECMHDYSAACPFGWFHGDDECVAPLTYNICGKRKSFNAATPATKEDWAHNCKVKFPCSDRSTCQKEYAAPCPADWYAFGGGGSCGAPSSYSGTCAPVLNGLADLSTSEKTALEKKCEIQWPCTGEVYAAVLRVKEDSTRPRKSTEAVF